MMDELITVAREIQRSRYPQAQALFLAGSVIRGEGTVTSDLDVVVVFKELPNAYRESFRFMNWPVEAFVHDPQTLNYFFFEIDRPSGVPSLPAMVSEGIEIPEPSELSRSLKQWADFIIAQGPPSWGRAEIDDSRYAITGLVDDLREPRSRMELMASAAALYSALANHYFRKHNLWSAKDKTIPRQLLKVDPRFAGQFNDSFEELFRAGQTEKLIALVKEVLKPDGGWLFEGYKTSAPSEWRTTKNELGDAV